MASAAHAAQPFPAVNHVYTVDFGSTAFDLNFKSSSEMAFTGVKGVVPTNAETVTNKTAELRDGQFAVTWSDSTGKGTHRGFHERTGQFIRGIEGRHTGALLRNVQVKAVTVGVGKL